MSGSLSNGIPPLPSFLNMKYSLTTMLAILKEHGCPEPVPEYRFAPPRRWRFDQAWPAQKIAFEFEGGVWTGGGHVRGKVYTSNCEKYNEAALLGWLLIRATADQVASGDAAEWLLRAFNLRAEA